VTTQPSPTELWLVRHGETDWNRQGLYQGQSDIPLNETGLAQAREAARQIAEAGRSFTALYSSPLSRAYHTAQETANLLNLPVRIDARLREINQGSWQGLNFDQVVEQFSDIVQAAEADPLNRRAPGGETPLEVAERVAAAADDIARAHPGETVLVFSHGFALATLVCQARGIPLEQVYQHIPDNAHAEVVWWPALNHLTK
jgi:broad specificity phosphatase PhoE